MTIKVAGRNRAAMLALSCIATLAGLGGLSVARALAAGLGANGAIVFEKDDSGGVLQVWSANQNGTNAKQLTHDVGDIADPAASPDGQRIAFVASSGRLTVMNADGSAQSAITPNNAELTIASPTWSPDGTKIAFVYRNQADHTPEDDIAVINSDGSGSIVKLTTGVGRDSIEPAWSPNGNTIAFVRSESAVNSTNQIWTMGSNGSNPTQLTATNFDSDEPAWSPDSTTVIFSNVDSGKPQLAVINKNGLGEGPLTTATPEMTHPAYSPQGDEIVARGLDSNTAANTGLYLVDPATGVETQLLATTFGGSDADHPSWAPVPQDTLTAAIAGSGSGSVTSAPAGIACPGTCSEHQPTGTEVTLTATAATGSYFAGWSGGGCSGTSTCTVTLNSATSVTATFDADPVLSVTISGLGAVGSPTGINCTFSGGTCSVALTPGTAVHLYATASPGSLFTGWSGGGCSGAGACFIDPTASTNVSATFVAIPGSPTGSTVISPLSWSAVAFAGGGTVRGSWWLDGVSCPSLTLCVAVGWDSVASQFDFPIEPLVLVSTNPASGNWGSVSNNGVDIGLQTYRLTAISCPSTNLCVAVDDGGDVFTNTTPSSTHGTWNFDDIDGRTPIEAISCATPSSCVAADQAGNVLISTNPTGGASAWHSTHVAPGLDGIDCPTLSLCVADDDVGDVITANGNSFSNTPATSAPWVVANVDGNQLMGPVRCSGGTCLVGDHAGNLLTSTNPAGGAGAWHATALSSAAITGISCPTTSLCVAGDSSGRIFESATPTGGASTWKSASVLGELTGLSCTASPTSIGAEDLCVATEGDNGVSVGTYPRFSIQRFGNGSGTVGVTSGSLSWSCPSQCGKYVTAPTTAKLTVTPDAGSALSSWSVPGCGTSLTCTVSVDADTTVGLVFSKATVSLGGPITMGGGGGTTTFKCLSKTVCAGTVVVSSPAGTIARAKKPAKPTIVGRASFQIKPHTRSTIRIHLTAAGKRLTTRRALHRVELTITTKAPKHKRLISVGTAKVRY